MPTKYQKDSNDSKISYDNFLTQNDQPLLTGGKFAKAVVLIILIAAAAAIFCGYMCFLLTRLIYNKWKSNKSDLQKCQLQESQQLVIEDVKLAKKQNLIFLKNNNDPVTISTIVHCTPNGIESILEQNNDLSNSHYFGNEQEQKAELEMEKIYMV